MKSKVKTEDDQEKLNKTINLKITPFDEWTDTNYQVANHMINQIQELNAIKSGEVEEKDLALMLHGHKTTNSKENDKMATQDVGDPIVVKTEAETETPAPAAPAVEVKSAPAQVSEPRVAELVEKTGEAILTEADAQDKKGSEYTPVETDQVAELKAQMKSTKSKFLLYHSPRWSIRKLLIQAKSSSPRRKWRIHICFPRP